MKVLVLLVFVVLPLFLLVGSALPADHWNVTMIRSSGDTIWVQAEPWYEYGPPCGGGGGDCMSSSQRLYLSVSPCPLSVTCTGPAYDTLFYGLYAQTTLGLKAGVNYTFSGAAEGNLSVWWFQPPPEPPVCMLVCSGYTNFEPVVFGGPVGTKPLTWGAIKALFR
jgi:hypothetical protein